MFLIELEKYSGDMPIVSLFEEVNEEAFVLLLEYSPASELKQILPLVPLMRPDIHAIVKRVMMEKTNSTHPRVMVS